MANRLIAVGLRERILFGVGEIDDRRAEHRPIVEEAHAPAEPNLFLVTEVFDLGRDVAVEPQIADADVGLVRADREIELEDSNLFALNRFPGYDRWEDGARVTYGADWSLDGPRLALRATIGQSYRLDRDPQIFPQGTGLAGRLSDVVGRTNLRFGRQLELVHRYRLDKDNLAVRRNELDLTFGSYETYVRVGYLRLNRDIATEIEDLRDKEEVRLGGRVRFFDNWSVFGSAIVDLTDAEEDRLSSADGYEPVRHRFGVAYEDECAEFALTWRRDYDGFGDFGRGNTFQLRISLKNLGR